MLRQEINLYHTLVPATPRDMVLTWQRFWLSHVFLLAMLFLLYFGSLWDLYALKSEKTAKQNQLTLLQAKFMQTKNTYPQLFFSQDLNQIMNQLQQDLVNKQKLLTSITNQIPFSQALLAFSRTISANVWLTQILIAEGGQNINLKGKSISMQNLQSFLDNLSRDKAFTNFNISTQDVENTNKAIINGILNFEIEIDKK